MIVKSFSQYASQMVGDLSLDLLKQLVNSICSGNAQVSSSSAGNGHGLRCVIRLGGLKDL